MGAPYAENTTHRKRMTLYATVARRFKAVKGGQVLLFLLCNSERLGTKGVQENAAASNKRAGTVIPVI